MAMGPDIHVRIPLSTFVPTGASERLLPRRFSTSDLLTVGGGGTGGGDALVFPVRSPATVIQGIVNAGEIVQRRHSTP